MATVVYERRDEETKLYAAAVTYPADSGVARCTVYSEAEDWMVKTEDMEALRSYQSSLVDIPLSRVVRVERE